MRVALRLVVMLAGLMAVSASAQDACESKCNQESAACQKQCTAPLDTKAKDYAKKMMDCVHTCEAPTKACKSKCPPSAAKR